MSTPSWPAVAVADWFLRKVDRPAGDAINALKLHSLLYFAGGWSLAVLGHPLFDENIEGWEHGPVVPSIWKRLSSHGWNDLPVDALDAATAFDAETTALLEDVFRAYGEFTMTELGKMACDTLPWKESRRGLPPWDLTKRTIDREALAAFFRQQLDADPASASVSDETPDGLSKTARLATRYG